MHAFQEKRIFLQQGDTLGVNVKLFALISIINQKFRSVRFGRTLGSEFGRTELPFDICRTKPSCSAGQLAKVRPKRTYGSPLLYFNILEQAYPNS